MLELLGQTPGVWTLPICDQGRNFWTYDFTNNGELQIDSSFYVFWPCACGHQGDVTTNSYKALGTDDDTVLETMGNCEKNLLKVNPALPKAKENIDWNAISGGKADKTVESGSHMLAAAASDPTKVCQLKKGDGVYKQEPKPKPKCNRCQ
ncbi:hypothetical protein MMC21_003766 [Puttea exsequens]|nr:hypothetical protein [Puttea exsequens]